MRVSYGPQRDATESSCDYESGLPLPGLSVNPLHAEPWWTRPLGDWIARRICNYMQLLEDGRRMWVLEGREVARGPDHEPIVTDVVPVAWLSDRCIEEAEARYRERFDVGQDST